MSIRQRRELRKILVAAVIFAALMIIMHVDAAPDVFRGRLISTCLFAVPYLICGLPVLKKCVKGIGHGKLFDESFLMTVATAGNFVVGQSAEAAAVMLFYQIGEFFQEYAVNRSRGSIKELLEIAPDFANRENEDGSIDVIDPDEAEIGDILVIKPGEKIPTDGIIISGSGMVDTAALTGESVPRMYCEGDEILSGCINGDTLLRIRCEREYDDSAVARIIELVETASGNKSKTEDFITRFAGKYTPIVVFGAVALAIIPPLFDGDWIKWMLRACIFLVISCPCALVISVPLSFFGGIGAASKNGILVKGSNYLELMADIDSVVTDKTGTLTKGEFKVSAVIPAEGFSKEDVIEAAAAAEGSSTHPIAVSIREACGKKIAVASDAVNVAGSGVICRVNGKETAVGNAALMERVGTSCPRTEDPAATAVYVAVNKKFIGTILLSDTVKPEAKTALATLRRAGVKRTVMLTGDARAKSEAVAKVVGIDEVYAELLPEDKVAAVEKIIKENAGRKGALVFIGDGINDAPVLARADVGVAMGSLGSGAAIEAADIVIVDDDLGKLPVAVGVAKKTVGIAKQNIAFALAVKVLCLALGALGIVGIWTAVFADVGVAIICILNSMRMLRYGKRGEKGGGSGAILAKTA